MKSAPSKACSSLSFVLGLCVFASLRLCGNALDLAWDPSPTATEYKLYYGPAKGVYTNLINVANSTSVTVTGLVTGATYHFAVTAWTAALPSFSSDLAYTVPTTNLALITIVQIEQADQLTGPWTNARPAASITNFPTSGQFFLRARLTSTITNL